MMKDREIHKLVGLLGKCSYNETNKSEFKRLGMKFARDIRARLALEDACVHYNAGGIAVSGDVSLHSEHLYLFFNADNICGDLGVCYRKCNGKKDYGTGVNSPNHWLTFSWIADYGIEAMCERLKKFMATNCAPNNMKCFASHEPPMSDEEANAPVLCKNCGAVTNNAEEFCGGKSCIVGRDAD